MSIRLSGSTTLSSSSISNSTTIFSLGDRCYFRGFRFFRFTCLSFDSGVFLTFSVFHHFFQFFEFVLKSVLLTDTKLFVVVGLTKFEQTLLRFPSQLSYRLIVVAGWDFVMT